MRLRQEIEGEARDELQRARESLEAEGRNSASGKLCATPFGIDVVGISQVRQQSSDDHTDTEQQRVLAGFHYCDKAFHIAIVSQ